MKSRQFLFFFFSTIYVFCSCINFVNRGSYTSGHWIRKSLFQASFLKKILFDLAETMGFRGLKDRPLTSYIYRGSFTSGNFI